jgi:hypothetical protein
MPQIILKTGKRRTTVSERAIEAAVEKAYVTRHASSGKTVKKATSSASKAAAGKKAHG